MYALFTWCCYLEYEILKKLMCMTSLPICSELKKKLKIYDILFIFVVGIQYIGTQIRSGTNSC